MGPETVLRSSGAKQNRCAAAVLATITAFILGGCAGPRPPAKDQLLERLSFIVLDPTITCAELRDHFQLHDLPVVDTPDELGLGYVNQWVIGSDSAALHVWYLPAQLNRGTVVLSMGASGRMACYLFVTQLLVHNGWSVVMYEYQGFGESQGVPSLGTLVGDLETVVNWTRSVATAPRVTLLGISLGTIPSVAIAAKRPDAVNGVILDSPVALSSELRRFSFLLGGDVEDYVARLDPELLTEVMMPQVTQPTLFFLNEADIVTPPATIERLYGLANEPKELVRFPDLEHALGPYAKTAIYTVSVERFLSSIWGKGRSE